MPIPTRTLSLREPRPLQKQKPSPPLAGPGPAPKPEATSTIAPLDHPRTIKPRSNTTTSALAAPSSRLANPPSFAQPASGLPQPATAAAAATANSGIGGVGRGDNPPAARRRSLLPQRNSWHRGAASLSSGRLTLQQQQPLQESQLQRVRDAQTQGLNQVQAAQSPVSAPLDQVAEQSKIQQDAKVQPQSQQQPQLEPSLAPQLEPATSPKKAQTTLTSRLERRGSLSASKLDTLKSQGGTGLTSRLERPGSSSTTSSQLSRPQSMHGPTRLERPGSSSTTSSQISRPAQGVNVNVPTARHERAAGSANSVKTKPEAPKLLGKATTRLERSASLRQPVSSRISTATHARHQSQVIGAGVGVGVGAGAEKEKGHTSVKQGDGNNASSTPSVRATSKPNFSTFQQHFSPKKDLKSKPPVPTTATSYPVTTSETTTDPHSSHPHVLALQAELLQLHLLHANSLQSRREWEASAEQHLRKQHKGVVAKYRMILAREKAVQRHVNTQALHQLRDDIRNNNSRYDFAGQIQILSRVVQDVADLTDRTGPGGRYTACVRAFEEWVVRAGRVRQGRKSNTNNTTTTNTPTCQFIDPLSHKWKEEVAALSAKLDLCARELDCLDVRDEDQRQDYDHNEREQGQGQGQGQDGRPFGAVSGSALARTVCGHKTLLASMLEELEVMRAVEADVVGLERVWVRRAVGGLLLRDGGGGKKVGGERGRPAWVVG
ncbi:hypothetical protein FQN50_005370 [Emmonsiellopsis sp. PD_5]|nr:hypothetical protein FQN50_005370 [Emmonsiellopsis sp. PD_5]